jgi:hypothetical protein
MVLRRVVIRSGDAYLDKWRRMTGNGGLWLSPGGGRLSPATTIEEDMT